MTTRFADILKRIEGIEKEIDDLKLARTRIPAKRPYTVNIEIAFDKEINALLNEQIQLEELEIENPTPELINEIISVDLATSTRMHAPVEKGAEPSIEEKRVKDFIRALPKTEVHIHMEACISKETLAQVLEKNHKNFEMSHLEKLYKFSNLQEFVQLFLFIIDSIISPDDFIYIFNNLRTYFEKNNIRYGETFFAPSRMIQNGLNFNEIAQTLDKLSRECRLEGGPDIRFLVDVSRTFGPENASKNLQHVLNAKSNSIIGIGLGGAELMGPAHQYRDVFAQARAEGLHTVAHAGEDDGPWSVRDTVEILKAERIGHGTSAIQDPELIKLLKERQVPIEICLTSNIFTGKYVRKEENHPVRRYYDEGLICCINTDDPEIFNIDLTDEFFKLHKHLNFSIAELVDLIYQGIDSSFYENKLELKKSFQNEIEILRKNYSL